MVRVRTQNVTVNVRATRGATVNVVVNQASKPKRRPRRLVFGKGNAKLSGFVRTFSLPAGYTCPFAQDCLSRAHRRTGKITDGPDTQFRCFSASDEARLPSVRAARWHNFAQLRGKDVRGMADRIDRDLPPCPAVRVHVSGDFFSLAYLDAWLEVARRRPSTLFYFYTKSVRHWIARLDAIGDGHTPGALPNVVPTASYGGKDDSLIAAHGLRSAVVIVAHSRREAEQEAEARGLAIDHDDSHPMAHGADFALLIHGTQPGGTDASRAIQALRKAGEYGYGEKADAIRQGRKTALPLA